MMTGTDRYIRWLRSLVGLQGSEYHNLLCVAWETEYEYYIPNDYNRANDGSKLRVRFTSETSESLPDLGGCRMLEFLIGVALRLNYIVDDDVSEALPEHFWGLLEALDLDRFEDESFVADGELVVSDIDYTFRVLNQREYEYDGSNGGLFPLDSPHEDQTKVEVWYQMMAYLGENLTF